jgi:hypothetical protein
MSDARPHPSPLPQEREKLFPCSGEIRALDLRGSWVQWANVPANFLPIEAGGIRG